MRWREEPRDGARAEVPLAVLVIVGLVVGAGLAAWWSVTRASASTASSSEGPADGDWTGVGWAVPAEQPWLGSVVRVTSSRCGRVVWGSGVVVDGVVLTDRHVVDGASRIEITTADGAVHQAAAVNGSRTVDMAAVTAPGLGEGLDLAAERSGASGESDAAYDLAGFPGGGALQVRRVTFDREQRGFGYPDPERPIRLAARVIPGESGSPLIDADGDVAALVYARATVGGAGLAISASELRSQLGSMPNLSLTGC